MENKRINLITQLQEIQCDSKIGKSRHFIAADRKARNNKTLGVSVIGISVLIGSTLINLIENVNIQRVVLAFFGFLAAGLSAMQTFFSFSKEIENHRKVGNLYLDIARDCDNILSKYNDEFIDHLECQKAFESILERYKNTNKEEEVCPNSKNDYKKAYDKNKEMKKRVQELKNQTLYSKTILINKSV